MLMAVNYVDNNKALLRSLRYYMRPLAPFISNMF